MNGEDTPEYEYEYSLDECTPNFEYASGYKSEYSTPKFDYDPSPKPSADDLIVFKAYYTIKAAHPNWSDEDCLKTAYTWFLKKVAAK